MQVTDGISTTTNLITNSLSLGMFADITIDYLGSDAVELTIATDKVYTITFSTGSDYFENESTYNIGGSTQQVVRYVASQLLSDTNASLISLASDIASISVDTNNDTVPDTSIAPLANLSGERVQDNEAPIVTGTYLTVTQEVVLSASDNKSGVLAISYSLDNGVTFVSYSKPFQVNPNNVTVVKAIAQDKVGNWSNVVHINIPKPSSLSQFTLDLVSIGQGTVSYDRAGPYPSGTQVQLTATPAAGWRFVRWESTVALGDQATQSIITVTVTGNATYSAHFALIDESVSSIYLPLINR